MSRKPSICNASFPPIPIGKRTFFFLRMIEDWEANVTVEGRPDWVFCKLHTHGAKESNSEQLLGDNMKLFHIALAEKATNDPEFKYYYVTAYEMAQLVHAAESGETNPENILMQYPKKKFNSKANV